MKCFKFCIEYKTNSISHQWQSLWEVNREKKRRKKRNSKIDGFCSKPLNWIYSISLFIEDYLPALFIKMQTLIACIDPSAMHSSIKLYFMKMFGKSQNRLTIFHGLLMLYNCLCLFLCTTGALIFLVLFFVFQSHDESKKMFAFELSWHRGSFMAP